MSKVDRRPARLHHRGYPPDGGAAPVQLDGDQVDAIGPGAKCRGRLHHATTFDGGELVRRVVPDPGLDLYCGDDPIDTHQQVDLTTTYPEVPLQQPPSSPMEKPEGNRLADPT